MLTLLCFGVHSSNAIFIQQLDANENKAHPDHIQAEANGFTVGSIGSNGRINSPVHKNRLNGVIPRMNMNITPNPMADGDKVLYKYHFIAGNSHTSTNSFNCKTFRTEL